ncbi:MAG: hypothetical protein HXS45_06215, partial [Theionarchaea archaeon]|nr:hypothetical protein [Theionarchaea archaeon]
MLKGRKTDNFSMRVYLETIEGIVGQHGLKSVLNYAHLQKYIGNFPPLNDRTDIPLEDLQMLCRSLLELFGRRGIRNLQLRIGREIVKKSFEKYSRVTRLLLRLRFLSPEQSRLKHALILLIRVVKKRYPSEGGTSQPQLKLDEEEDCFLITFRDNWESEDVLSPSPVCHVTIGAIAALAEWATGHVYDVREIECRAMGYPVDVFRISRAYEKEVVKGSYDSSKDRLRPFLIRF